MVMAVSTENIPEEKEETVSTQAVSSPAETALRTKVYVASVVAAVALVVSGLALAVGVAMQQGAVMPPELDVRLGRAHLMAYVTHTPACVRSLTPCPPELIESPAQDFYDIWVLTQTRQPAPPDEREIATRILTLPLRQR